MGRDEKKGGLTSATEAFSRAVAASFASLAAASSAAARAWSEGGGRMFGIARDSSGAIPGTQIRTSWWRLSSTAAAASAALRALRCSSSRDGATAAPFVVDGAGEAAQWIAGLRPACGGAATGA